MCVSFTIPHCDKLCTEADLCSLSNVCSYCLVIKHQVSGFHLVTCLIFLVVPEWFWTFQRWAYYKSYFPQIGA